MSVDAVAETNQNVVPELVPVSNSKKALLKFVIQAIISILTAILTALGVTSCMGL